MTNLIALCLLLFDALAARKDLKDVEEKCETLLLKLREKSSDILEETERLCQLIKINGMLEDLANMMKSEMSTFLENYMNQVLALLRLIRATREGNWELYVTSLEEQVKYYFAHDLYNYARLVPFHLAQLQELKLASPETWENLKKGDFCVSKSGIPFTNLFVDQCLEQKIRGLKVMGGITGITQNKEALDRYFVIAPQLAKIVDDFQNHFGEEKQSRTLDHYQLHGSMSSRLQKMPLNLKIQSYNTWKETPLR